MLYEEISGYNIFAANNLANILVITFHQIITTLRCPILVRAKCKQQFVSRDLLERCYQHINTR